MNIAPSKITISLTSYKKPFVKHEIEFNMSATKTCAIYVFNQLLPIGIDIESINKQIDLQQISQRYFTQQENTRLKNECNYKNAFYKIWTRKEAYVKAVGEGRSIPP